MPRRDDNEIMKCMPIENTGSRNGGKKETDGMTNMKITTIIIMN